MIRLASPRDLDEIARAGALLDGILRHAVARVAPGVTTAAIDAFIRERMREAGAEPVMEREHNPRGGAFGHACSVTINEEVMHAPPGPRRLREGDVFTIDAALRLGGWCVDAARCGFVAGTSSRTSGHDRADLPGAVRRVLAALIDALEPGRRWSEAWAAAMRACPADLQVIPGFGAHGIGRRLHEPPAIEICTDPVGHAPLPRQDLVLRPGMVLAIEPILMAGTGVPETVELDDGWTIATRTRGRACFEEETVAVTRRGPRVLTRA